MSPLIEAAVPPFPFAGEVFSLAAAIIWSCSLSTYKAYGEVVTSQVLNLYKNSVAVVCLGLTVIVTGASFPERAEEWFFLIASGVAGIAVGDTAYFASLRRAGAQLSSALQCLAPPLTAVLAVAFLGETLSQKESVGIFVTVSGLAGLLWLRRRERSVDLTRVSGNVLGLGVAFALLSAFGQALGVVLTRHVMKDVDIFAGAVLRIIPAVVLLWCAGFLIGRKSKSPENTIVESDSSENTGIRKIFQDRKTALALTLAAFFGTFLGIVLMTAGVKYAKAGVAAALSSSYPIFIIPIAHFILKERVTIPMIVMTVISVIGIAYMF